MCVCVGGFHTRSDTRSIHKLRALFPHTLSVCKMCMSVTTEGLFVGSRLVRLLYAPHSSETLTRLWDVPFDYPVAVLEQPDRVWLSRSSARFHDAAPPPVRLGV